MPHIMNIALSNQLFQRGDLLGDAEPTEHYIPGGHTPLSTQSTAEMFWMRIPMEKFETPGKCIQSKP